MSEAKAASRRRLRLGELGDVPAPAFADLLKTVLWDVPLTADADALVSEACETDEAAGKLDHAVYRVLPQLVGTHAHAALDERRRARVQTIAMRNMVRFAALEQQAAAISATLLEAGITPLMLKGFPLAATFYKRPSDRPMGDLDIAVPAGDFDRALAALQGIGLVRSAQDPATRMGVNDHAVAVRDPNGMSSVDLHYHVLSTSLWQGADDGFWERAIALPLTGARGPVHGALTLAAEDHLLHACMHGYSRVRSHSVFRWITDSVAILRSAGAAFRWDVLIEEANRQRCGPMLAASLRYLVDTLEVPVPAWALTALSDGTAHSYDIGYFRATTQMSHSKSSLLRMRYVWLMTQRQLNRPLRSPRALGPVLAWRWGCSSVWQLPGEFLRRRRADKLLRSGPDTRPPLIRSH